MMMRDGPKGKRFWGAVAVTAFTVFVLCALGVWQLLRADWKTDLVAALNDKTALMAAPNLPVEDITPSNPTPVLFFGHYRPEYSIFVRQGERMIVYMPFQTDKGEMILMRRGVMPYEDMAGKVIDDGSQDTQVSVIGVPVPRPSSIPFMRETYPNGLVWSLMDWAAVQEKFAFFKLAPFIVQVVEDTASPMKLDTSPLEIRNEHVHYAIFWFVMAGVALWLFSRFMLFPPRREQIQRDNI